MTDEAGGRAEHVSVRSLDDLRALRSDWEDVTVESLGGAVLRVYALSGTARARLMPEMADLIRREDQKDPETVAALLEFQCRAVGASLGLPEEAWAGTGAAIGADAVEQLYAVVGRLSGLSAEEQAKASRRLRPTRSAGSGSD